MEPEAAGPNDRPRETTYGLLQRGQALMQSRHHAQAAIVLSRAAHQEPGKASILEPLGRAYYNSGQHQLARETFELVLQVNGRVRDRVEASAGESDEQLVERAKASPKVQAHLDGKEIRQTIVVPGKLVNLVV